MKDTKAYTISHQLADSSPKFGEDFTTASSYGKLHHHCLCDNLVAGFRLHHNFYTPKLVDITLIPQPLHQLADSTPKLREHLTTASTPT